jgi:integrase
VEGGQVHFPEFSTHDLRALFITVALEQGVPLEEVQEQAGHESADTTARYKGRRNEYAKAQLRRVDFTASPPTAEGDSSIVNLQRWRPNGRRS